MIISNHSGFFAIRTIVPTKIALQTVNVNKLLAASRCFALRTRAASFLKDSQTYFVVASLIWFIFVTLENSIGPGSQTCNVRANSRKIVKSLYFRGQSNCRIGNVEIWKRLRSQKSPILHFATLTAFLAHESYRWYPFDSAFPMSPLLDRVPCFCISKLESGGPS